MSDETYAGTTGHSGTDTSEATAGLRGQVQGRVLQHVAYSGERGITVKELRAMMPSFHHGTLSSALTNMHRAGRIVRLVEQRGRCKVYVAPEHVAGRPTEEPRRAVPRVAPEGPRITVSETGAGWHVAIDTNGMEGQIEVDLDGRCLNCSDPWAATPDPDPEPPRP